MTENDVYWALVACCNRSMGLQTTAGVAIYLLRRMPTNTEYCMVARHLHRLAKRGAIASGNWQWINARAAGLWRNGNPWWCV